MRRRAGWRAKSDKIVVKLPMTPEGIAALTLLKREEPSHQARGHGGGISHPGASSQARQAPTSWPCFNGPLDTVSDTPR